MSQVNDALKRVRDTSAPPGEVAPLRSLVAAPAPAPARSMGLMLPIVFIAVALLGLSVFLQFRQRQIVSARQPPATIKPAPMHVASDATAKQALPPAAPNASTSSPVAAGIPTAAPTPTPVIKLQGILYAGHGSSAMISGQTLMTGDEIGGYRVAAIGQHSVTLVCATHTNVLSLGR